MSRPKVVQIVHLILRVLDFLADSQIEIGQDAARFSRLDLAAGADQQTAAEFLFEHSDLAVYRRMRNVQQLPRWHVPARFDHIAKQL